MGAKAEMLDDFLSGFDDDQLVAIGSKIAEMAWRAAMLDRTIPGARATWGFEIDGEAFRVSVVKAAKET